MKLTATQKMALLYLLRYENWTSDAPVNPRCLNALINKDLVEIRFDYAKVRWVERLTEPGREMANEIKERIDK